MKHKTKKLTLLMAGITLTSLCTVFAITACSKQKSQSNSQTKPNKVIEKVDQAFFDEFKTKIEQKRTLPNIKITSTFKIPFEKNENTLKSPLFKIGDKSVYDLKQNEIPITWVQDLKDYFLSQKTILTYYALANLKLTGTDAKGAYFLQFIQYVQKMQQKGFLSEDFYQQLWYLVSEISDYDMQNGILRSVYRIANPNLKIKDLYLDGSIYGFKKQKSKYMNFTNLFQWPSNDEKVCFDIVFKNKNTNQTYTKNIELTYSKEKKYILDSLIDYSEFAPGEYELVSIKKHDDTNAKNLINPNNPNIARIFKVKVFKENEKFKPITLATINQQEADEYDRQNNQIIYKNNSEIGILNDPNKIKELGTFLYFKKPLSEITIDDLDRYFKTYFINPEQDFNNFSRQYKITKIDKEKQTVELSVLHINNKTNETYVSPINFKFHYQHVYDVNKNTDAKLELNFDESKKEQKQKLQALVNKLDFNKLTYNDLSELALVMFEDVDLENTKIHVEMIKNKDRSITLKAYVDKAYKNGKLKISNKADILIKEFKVNYFMTNYFK
ncbi:hypothetical protein [Ureaplasma urealyticum]|uniref:Iron ABC transporter substrate-binding protein n=1 Tax=Ureaplasma urealyticum TaxID=2130 RepID=A0AAX1QZJ8_UREUR|nr:hypothetical protein [Ureaplasma urealyticum]EDX54215.1 putative lipoprotein [Ureaplasma urealyticum serovar 9 str. ATCC 33175]RCJ01800.1 hypothetical protein DSQ42_00535 [Ureaplasma urealyticum]UNT66326.1 hypothetical protein IF687_00525 [Ureaplasma urealyticum]